MQQHSFQNNILNLKVKKSPYIVRLILFILAFAFFAFPIVGTIFGIVLGSGLHIGYFISIGIFSLIGFYSLRIALWNTYGQETIQILENKVIYEVNYGWFNDGKKETLISNPSFESYPSGFVEDNQEVLIITEENLKVESAVKMPATQMQELLLKLREANNWK
ncbi:hypothetical protein [Flavobacterium olei]|uniref:hypothetical protein n=1 Tax=Flavobacterium olei TaxID=1886782 RepID=UPI00321A2996